MAALSNVSIFSLQSPINLTHYYSLSFLRNHLRIRRKFSNPIRTLATRVSSTLETKLPPCSSRSNVELEPYLSCSMPGKRLKVATLLSGGVDSSVALRLLHHAGHSCTAFYLKIWFQEDYENFWSACPWDEDLQYAEAVCKQVGVPLEIVHFTDEYWNNVVSHIIEEYRVGRTPNPDVLCNTRIKFGQGSNLLPFTSFSGPT